MLDTVKYTAERVAPITGPRKPKDHKGKGGKARRRISGGGYGGSMPLGPLAPGATIIVSNRILDELNAISAPPPMINPRPLDLMRGIADPYFSGYPIVARGILA